MWITRGKAQPKQGNEKQVWQQNNRKNRAFIVLVWNQFCTAAITTYQDSSWNLDNGTLMLMTSAQFLVFSIIAGQHGITINNQQSQRKIISTSPSPLRPVSSIFQTVASLRDHPLLAKIKGKKPKTKTYVLFLLTWDMFFGFARPSMSNRFTFLLWYLLLDFYFVYLRNYWRYSWISLIFENTLEKSKRINETCCHSDLDY